MKKITIAAFAATFAGALVVGMATDTAHADAPAINASANYVSGVKPRNVCLRSYRIDRTTYQREDNSLLFHMKNGKIWKNHLRSPCNGLSFNGFSYVNHTGQICGNFQSIQVLQNGQVCLLGPFTPYVKPAREKVDLN